MTNLSTAEKIDQLMAAEVYTKLEEHGCNVSLLKQKEAEIKGVMVKAIFEVGAALEVARTAFPEEAGGAKGDDSWAYWVDQRLGMTKRSANRYRAINKAFGNVGHACPASLSFRVLNELSGKKYSPLVRETVLAEAAEAEEPLTTKDIQIINSLALAEDPKSVAELRELIQQVNSGYIKAVDDMRVDGAMDTFKASNAHASTMARTAQTYRENKQFAPPKVIEKVEDDMTHAISAWVEALPPTRLTQIRKLIDERLHDATAYDSTAITINSTATSIDF